MNPGSRLIAAALSPNLLLIANASADPVVTDSRIINDDRRVAILEAMLASLRQQVTLLEDAKAIERLQQTYGYYVSEGLGSEAAALFSDSPAASIELAQQGVYLGKKRIREFLTHGGEGLKDGELREGTLMQGVVNVSPEDGRSARGRWRTLIMGGTYGQDGTWTEGPFENEYVKENGVWKLSKVHWYMTVKGRPTRAGTRSTSRPRGRSPICRPISRLRKSTRVGRRFICRLITTCIPSWEAGGVGVRG